MRFVSVVLSKRIRCEFVFARQPFEKLTISIELYSGDGGDSDSESEDVE